MPGCRTGGPASRSLMRAPCWIQYRRGTWSAEGDSWPLLTLLFASCRPLLWVGGDGSGRRADSCRITRTCRLHVCAPGLSWRRRTDRSCQPCPLEQHDEHPQRHRGVLLTWIRCSAPLVDDGPDGGSIVCALDVEFADPTGQINGSVILALPSKPRNSMYVSSVIAPTCASALSSETAKPEIFNDFPLKTTPFIFRCASHCFAFALT